jgi:hypothetical protein
VRCSKHDTLPSATLPVLFDYLRGGPLGTLHKHGTSPCIVLGEAGVGKTSAVYHLASRAAATGEFLFFETILE